MEHDEYTPAASARRTTDATGSPVEQPKLQRHFGRNPHLHVLAEEATVLRARMARCEISTEDFMEWLLQSADHVQVWLELTAFDEEAARALHRLGMRSEISALDDHERGLSAKSPRQLKWLAWAASLIVSLVLFFVWLDRRPSHQIIATGAGQLHHVTLSDGTAVHIDARSKVQVEYTDNARIVHVYEGSAAFEVAKDSNRPFIARTSLIDATAVGTKFGIAIDPGVTTTVSEGIVRITGHEKADVAVVLKAGEELRVSDSSLSSPHFAHVDAQRSLEWTRGTLMLSGLTIAEGIEQLNRRNAMQIVVDSPTLREQIVTFASVKADSPETYARLIAASPGITMVIDKENNVIRLSD